jgi:hypothetical protein
VISEQNTTKIEKKKHFQTAKYHANLPSIMRNLKKNDTLFKNYLKIYLIEIDKELLYY